MSHIVCDRGAGGHRGSGHGFGKHRFDDRGGQRRGRGQHDGGAGRGRRSGVGGHRGGFWGARPGLSGAQRAGGDVSYPVCAGLDRGRGLVCGRRGRQRRVHNQSAARRDQRALPGGVGAPADR
ncbi:PE-PGRS family protein [Mycobacterium tuberculosis str. Haarlem/NITR202]|uniref:PE-PGRS family protein n=2 Tax=Mycobacterium tuberculosis complex TaxID=77643 RepID=A0A829CHB1_9MYCO|nr:PE-PGRS family protein [Mycobacterium tuberculosis str. Beijing/NITR203]AGL22484.1 PE-PGRS family protein [Mycobacterium tuberculosis str. Haarlem/NITR202]AGL30184.1 PE-PGRS family protein [Mycobacterium tuberculosis EAI5/NITR206]EMT36950.1 PE-PGRS family protein [Mycobacterium orygis 112400015]